MLVCSKWDLLNMSTFVGNIVMPLLTQKPVRLDCNVLIFMMCLYSSFGEGNGENNNPTPVLLPGKSHGWRSLVGCSPWTRQESDTTKRLPFHFSLSCIGEGNGNPLQCSCLENPRDGGGWWAAVYGVAQSQTRLKWLSSSRIGNWKTQIPAFKIYKIIERWYIKW